MKLKQDEIWSFIHWYSYNWFWGCGEDVSDRIVDKPIENDLNENILQDEEIDTRFVSRDRDLKTFFPTMKNLYKIIRKFGRMRQLFRKTEGFTEKI